LASGGVAVSEPEVLEFREFDAAAFYSHAIVLMYHDVVPERTRETERYDVTAEQLREDLQYVVDNGGTFISLRELYDHLVQGKPIPHRAAVVTFDDNYQGVNDYGVPVLREFDAPWAMFVHTDFVGNTTQGRPKMTWETLQQLVKDSKLTIGAHTASHPNDLTLLEDSQKQAELEKSAQETIKQIGAAPLFMAWANGKYDETAKWHAQNSGYLMSFTMENGLTGASPGILEVNRYPWQKLRLAWAEREQWLGKESIWQPAKLALSEGIPEKLEARHRSARFVAIKGGLPSTVLIDGRESVGKLVEDFGGFGGINGGFFVMAAIKSTDNRMIGPCIVSNRSEFLASSEVPNVEKLRGRPLVIWSSKDVAITPYDPYLHDDDQAIKDILPDRTDAFLAGCWLVCDGFALSKDQILRHGPSDAMDWRRRAFIGWTADGQTICGASTSSVSAEWLAKGAVELGCVQAVMLDSGFSTSLIYRGEILASGHSNKDHASRPIPHAIILKESSKTESTVSEGASGAASGSATD
jgi:peptidoglycan/xylan/chitin deacetylase (PgdA/CDA1 family)